MKNLILVIFVFLFSGATQASSVNPTKITKILVGPNYGKNVILTVSKKPNDAPDCSKKNPRYDYVFDGTTESGKMTLSVVLTAYSTQKDVWLGGTNLCTLYDGMENLLHIVAQ